MYKVILLDLDNTLLNFDLAEAKAFRYTVKRFGFKYSKALFTKYLKINDAYWRLLEKGGITAQELGGRRFYDTFWPMRMSIDGSAMNDVFRTQLGQNVYYEDGALELLHYLKSKYQVYIVTNGVSSVQKSRLSISQIDRIVDGVVNSEEIGANKPSPEFFIKGLAKFGLDAKRTEDYLIIGDSLTSDMPSGETMGYDTIWYNRKNLTLDKWPLKKPATYEVHSLYDIIEIL